jgi:hypothetical protein
MPLYILMTLAEPVEASGGKSKWKFVRIDLRVSKDNNGNIPRTRVVFGKKSR